MTLRICGRDKGEKVRTQRGQELNGNHRMASIREERKVVRQVLWKGKGPGATGHQRRKIFIKQKMGKNGLEADEVQHAGTDSGL